MKRTPLLLAFLAAIFVGACVDFYQYDDPRVDDLRRAERVWRRSAIRDYNYEARFTSTTQLDGRYLIKVRNGAVVEAFHKSTDRPVNLSRIPVPTIEDLFDEIYDAIDRHFDEIEVYYDPEYGFPNYLYLDRRVHVYNDEFQVNIEKMTIFE